MIRPQTKFGDRIQKRAWARGGKSGESTHYYGRVREPGKPWRWFKLLTDKRASQRMWDNLRRESEHQQVGINRPEIDRLTLPVTDLAKRYHAGLRSMGKDPEHVRISEWMIGRLIELGGWKTWYDITPDSIGEILVKLDGDEATASYRNKFLSRAKAFASAFLPDSWAHPLRKVKRIREKGAKRNRARRAASLDNLGTLLMLDVPGYRVLAYTLAAYNGLRRNESQRLLWADVTLDAPVPFVGIRHKMRPDDEADFIPLHPFVVSMLTEWRKVARGPRVLPAVPDIKTLKKDWAAALVPFTDDRGRRLDYHALRHTFATNLSRFGASRATKKKLMRHANRDVTDGYTHAELAEMLSALEQIPPPNVVGLCPARSKTRDNDVKSTIPPTPLGYSALFSARYRGFRDGSSREGADCDRSRIKQGVARGKRAGKGRSRLASVRDGKRPNGGKPWSAHVQRDQIPASKRLNAAHRKIRRAVAGMLRRERGSK